MVYDRKDHFYKKAKQEGKASRAVYKLAELQRKFQLVRKGDIALDLGCSPGGWLQELSPLVGPKGKVVGIDLLPLKISVPPQCHFIHGDLTDPLTQREINKIVGNAVDVILCDMSPNLSGITFADAYRSYELAMLALDICELFLRKNGNFLVKIFPGDEFAGYITTLKKYFREVSVITPIATRKTSSERYIVAKGFRK